MSMSEPESPQVQSLEEVERAHIVHTIEVAMGNLSMTAKLLKVDRRTVYRLIKRYEIRLPDYRPTCVRLGEERQ